MPYQHAKQHSTDHELKSQPLGNMPSQHKQMRFFYFLFRFLMNASYES